MRRLLIAAFVLCLATSTVKAECEIHPAYNAEFRQSLINALYHVREQQQLAYIIYKLITIDAETTEHELAHYHTAQGWAEPPVYETVELYGKAYRIGGCVRTKPGIPLEVAYEAAMAPKDPSAHDLRLAAKFMLMMQQRGQW